MKKNPFFSAKNEKQDLNIKNEKKKQILSNVKVKNK